MPHEYTAVVHIVVKDTNGQHADVTPAEWGDEGKPIIFIPTSLLYPGVSASSIGAMYVTGLQPRLGTVCTKGCLAVKEEHPLYQGTPEKSKLWLVPMISTIKLHMAISEAIRGEDEESSRG